jgi:predicted transglutaminase-like cysteine proteinase
MEPKRCTATLSHVACALALVMLALVAVAASSGLGFSRNVTAGLVTSFERRFGAGAPVRIASWKEFVRATAESIPAASRSAGDLDLLRSVNRFINMLPGAEDIANWGVEDYWATPAEAFASGGADCEDYAIAKYFALRELGVPLTRLRLVYAKTPRANEAHMVLAYYFERQGDPLILDNLENDIRPGSQRPDLTPVYFFNEEDLVLPRAGQPTVRATANSNRKWQEVVERLERELTY